QRRRATTAARRWISEPAARPWLRRSRSSGAAEPPGLAVAFGLVPVVRLALRLEVRERGLATVRARVDVVPFEAVPAIATDLRARHALELGRRAEHECGLEVRGPVPAGL